MSAFAVASWVFCLLTSLLLFWALGRWRFLLIKPSIFFLLCFHVFIQWPAAVFAGDIQTFLSDPWSFGLMAQGFPLAGFAVSLSFGGRSARIVWNRLQHPKQVRRFSRRRAMWILGGCTVAIVAYYLSRVPLRSTGLYAVVFDPSAATLARESSLKLLADPLLQYGYSFLASVFAPLLAVLLAGALGRSVGRRRVFRSAMLLLAIVAVIAASSLTGARSFAATILMTVAVAWLLRRGFPFNPLYAVIAGVVVLAVPVILTILREGLTLDPRTFGNYLQLLIVDRVFYAPLETGMWFAQYAEKHGLLGVAAIPKLAQLFGIKAVNAPNLIGQIYTPWKYAFINANTGYVLAYYAYFGLASLPFSLMALWALDVALLAYRKISDNLLLACVASGSVATIGLISMEYSTVWLSGGFGVLLVVAFVVDRACRKRLRFGPVRLGGLRLARIRLARVRLGRQA
jgi:hypothetical protein